MMFGKRPTQRAEFEQLTLEHMDALYGAALRYTKNDRDAEDLVQDTVLRALRFQHRFEEGTHFRAWLFKILTNTFINKYRRSAKERQILDETDLDHGLFLSEETTRAARDPEGDILSHLFSGDVQAALDSLPEDFRIAVVLADLQDFSYKEIADIMECPVGTVMSRLYRGRRLLQQKLREYAEQEGLIQPQADADPAAAEAPASPASQSEDVINLTAYRRRRASGAG
jgi:RNA polymerase sigma-70 factor (ECF subfamily)